MPLPVHTTLQSGPLLERLRQAIPSLERVDGPASLPTDAAGVVLLDADTTLEDIASLHLRHPECFLLVVLDRDPPEVRSVSLGRAHGPEAVPRLAADPDGSHGLFLRLDPVLRAGAKLRHDANNPLTAAMAEIQLLLMDAEDEATREAAESVQEQLRRMGDVIRRGNHLRPERR